MPAPWVQTEVASLYWRRKDVLSKADTVSVGSEILETINSKIFMYRQTLFFVAEKNYVTYTTYNNTIYYRY